VWQAVASFAALITALAAAGVGVAGFVRSARAEDAKRGADAADVGLRYLERSLAAQQETITRQEGEIGALRGQLAQCREESHVLAAQLVGQATQIAELQERMS
jgi:hypothetical protein